MKTATAEQIDEAAQADMVKYPKVPGDVIFTLRMYSMAHIPTGGFLEAMLANDLRGACERADGHNRYYIWEIVNYIYNALPAECWGSRKAVRDWLDKKN